MGVATSPIFEFSQNMFTKPSATSMALAAGEVYQRTFQANSAYLALTTPDDVYDYTANSAIDGTGTKCGLMARNASGTTTFENFYGQGL